MSSSQPTAARSGASHRSASAVVPVTVTPDPQHPAPAEVRRQERQVRVGHDRDAGRHRVGQPGRPRGPGVQRSRVAGLVGGAEDRHQPATGEGVRGEQADRHRGHDLPGPQTGPAQPREDLPARDLADAVAVHHLDRPHVVGRPAVGPDGEAETAAGQVPGHPDRRGAAARRPQAVRCRRGRHVRPGRAGPDPCRRRRRVDTDPAHRRGVEQDPARGGDPEPVARRVHRHRRAVPVGDVEHGGDVRGTAGGDGDLGPVRRPGLEAGARRGAGDDPAGDAGGESGVQGLCRRGHGNEPATPSDISRRAGSSSR